MKKLVTTLILLLSFSYINATPQLDISENETITAVVQNANPDLLEELLKAKIQANILAAIDPSFSAVVNQMRSHDPSLLSLSEMLSAETYQIAISEAVFDKKTKAYTMMGRVLKADIEKLIIKGLIKHYSRDFHLQHKIVHTGYDVKAIKNETIIESIKTAYGVKITLNEVNKLSASKSEIHEQFLNSFNSTLTEDVDMHANYKVYEGSILEGSTKIIFVAIHKGEVQQYKQTVNERLQAIASQVANTVKEDGLQVSASLLRQGLELTYYHKELISDPISNKAVDSETFFKEYAAKLLSNLNLLFNVASQGQDSVVFRLATSLPSGVDLRFRNRDFMHNQLTFHIDEIKSTSTKLENEPIQLFFTSKYDDDAVSYVKSVDIEISPIQRVEIDHEMKKNGIKIYFKHLDSVLGNLEVTEPVAQVSKSDANSVFFKYDEIEGDKLIAKYPHTAEKVLIPVAKPSAAIVEPVVKPLASKDLSPRTVRPMKSLLVGQLLKKSGYELLNFIDTQLPHSTNTSTLQNGDHVAIIDANEETYLLRMVDTIDGTAISLDDEKPMNLYVILKTTSNQHIRVFNVN